MSNNAAQYITGGIWGVTARWSTAKSKKIKVAKNAEEDRDGSKIAKQYITGGLRVWQLRKPALHSVGKTAPPDENWLN